MFLFLVSNWMLFLMVLPVVTFSMFPHSMSPTKCIYCGKSPFSYYDYYDYCSYYYYNFPSDKQQFFFFHSFCVEQQILSFWIFDRRKFDFYATYQWNFSLWISLLQFLFFLLIKAFFVIGSKHSFFANIFIFVSI